MDFVTSESLGNVGFSDPDLYTIPCPKTEEEWLSRRSFCIGGSDVGAIMGLNDHKTPLQVYREKVDHCVTDTSDNVYIRKGKALEPLIFNTWVVPMLKELGYTATHPDFIFANKRYPFLQCNLDGVATHSEKESCIIEIKWVSTRGASNWNGDEYCGIPKTYYAQVQTYMAVTGAPRAYVFALFDEDWECKMYTIPRDNSFIDELLKACKTFYTVNMQMEVPPRPVYDKDAPEEIVAALEKVPEEHASESFTDLACDYLQKYKELKDISSQVDALKQQLFERYTDGERSTLPTVKMYVKPSTSIRFDVTSFKEALPDVYKQYLKTTQTTRFYIHKK